MAQTQGLALEGSELYCEGDYFPLYAMSKCGGLIPLWAVVRVHPGAISGNYEPTATGRALPLVLRHLERQNFEFYNPRYLRKAGLTAGRYVPPRRSQLFTNYLFVKIDEDWSSLRSTSGVCGVIFPSGKAEAERLQTNIEGLKLCEIDGLVQLNQRKFKVGQSVQIKTGPFSYLCGIVESMRDRDRIQIMMSWLGSVTVSEDNVMAA